MNPDEMTPEEINVAIAELCGMVKINEWFPGFWTCARATFPDEAIQMPNYYKSLDAMAQAEATLTDEEWELYADELLWADGQEGHSNYTSCRRGCSATAAERSRAFLRVKSKGKGGVV